ncbi:MAG: hypothetical protein MZU97_12480 [Bacillus subtilis]|nr:hypothetical protein [Bacillus subtilis]
MLRKAEEIRSANGTTGLDLSLDENSGISKEDQRDILVHIDRVAQSSRILAGPDTWKVRARRRGFTAPLLVNLFAVLILAAGLYGLWKFFDKTDRAQTASTAVISTAEGRLLQEIKREAEGRIQEKDREITAIQEKMAALDREKSQLLTSVEDRVKAKETELRAELAVELEKERQRLTAAGLTPSTIEERLKAFEREKSEALRRELDEYARKADEERLAIQAGLDKARTESQASLQSATTERQRILDESRKREQELRAQLDEKNKALESERARTAESLKAAQTELSKYNEDAAQARAAEDRLLGLYASARSAIQEGRLDDAVRSAEALRQYLSDPTRAGNAALSRRREADLFAVDLVERTVSAERARSSADSARVGDAISAMGRIREEAAKAKAALDSGNRAEADAAYRRMLAALPELNSALAFLDENYTVRTAGTTVQKDKLDRAWADLDAAYAAKDGPAFDAAFRTLLTTASLDEARAAAALQRAKEAGVTAWVSARRISDTQSAAAPLSVAAADQASRRWLEALGGYATVMARFPFAEQIPQAAEELRRSGRALADAFQKYRTDTEERIRVLDAQLAAVQGSTDITADRAARTTAAGVSPAEFAAMREERDRLKTDLETARARYDSVTAAYTAYAEEEDAILAKGGVNALVTGRARMDQFFSNDAVTAALPGMRARVARYLEAFQAAGQKEVLFNAADIVDGAARIRDPAVRDRYFRDLEARYAGNPSMLEFLQSMKESFR